MVLRVFLSLLSVTSLILAGVRLASKRSTGSLLLFIGTLCLAAAFLLLSDLSLPWTRAILLAAGTLMMVGIVLVQVGIDLDHNESWFRSWRRGARLVIQIGVLVASLMILSNLFRDGIPELGTLGLIVVLAAASYILGLLLKKVLPDERPT